MSESVLPPTSAPSFELQSIAPAMQAADLGNGLDRPAPAISDSGLDLLKSQVVEHVQELEPDTPEFDLNATHIQSSPYSDTLNQLNLTDLDQPLRFFALALTKWKAVRPDYATSDYMSTFNWEEVFSILRELCKQAGIQWQRTEFYVVIFRSKLRADADRTRLGELDQMSHQEACASGGLLHYWFGSTDDQNRNLATCVWRNREDAAAGGKGPWHRKARGAAREMYESISFHTHKLVVEAGTEEWHLEDYHN